MENNNLAVFETGNKEAQDGTPHYYTKLIWKLKLQLSIQQSQIHTESPIDFQLGCILFKLSAPMPFIWCFVTENVRSTAF